MHTLDQNLIEVQNQILLLKECDMFRQNRGTDHVILHALERRVKKSSDAMLYALWR